MTDYKERKEAEMKDRARNNYNLASLIALFVNQSFAGKSIPKISEVYPDFKEEEDKAMIQDYINKFKQFAIKHNKGV